MASALARSLGDILRLWDISAVDGVHTDEADRIVATARRTLRRYRGAPRCDGDHRPPSCQDPGCWQIA